MAIDNSLYDSLENTYVKINNYFENNKLGPEHSAMIINHEELSILLETLDIEALEEQSTDIHALHNALNNIKVVSEQIIIDLDDTTDSNASATKVVNGLKEIFSKISNLQVS